MSSQSLSHSEFSVLSCSHSLLRRCFNDLLLAQEVPTDWSTSKKVQRVRRCSFVPFPVKGDRRELDTARRAFLILLFSIRNN